MHTPFPFAARHHVERDAKAMRSIFLGDSPQKNAVSFWLKAPFLFGLVITNAFSRHQH